MTKETRNEKPVSSRLVVKVIAVLVLAAAVAFAVHLRQQHSAPVAPDSAVTLPATSSLPRLVDLGAEKCIPCKMMAPILEQLRDEYEGSLEVLFLDVRKNPDYLETYNVELIPTQIFYDAAGEELFRHVGFYSREEILAKWKELGVNLDVNQEKTNAPETR